MASKKNAFTEFRRRYAGEPTEAEKITAKVVAEMVEAYEATYNKIYRMLDTARGSVNYATYAKQTQLLKQIAEQLKIMSGKFEGYLSDAMAQIAKYSTQVAIKDLELISGTVKATEWHLEYNESYVEQMFKDSFNHVAAQTTRMKNSVKEMLRAETTAVMRRAAVEGLSRGQAYKLLKDQVQGRMPGFEFIDKAGRRWDSKVYFETLTRTVMMNAHNETYTNTLINEGKDLAKISVHGAKDACRNWEGRVISLTGATKGYPTLEEARATGEIFHPRCRHRLLPYVADADKIWAMVDEGKSDEEILKALS